MSSQKAKTRSTKSYKRTSVKPLYDLVVADPHAQMASVVNEDHKRSNGVYYTMNNPFQLTAFKEWAKEVDLTSSKILEPFAGANNIIKMLEHNYNIESCSFDIKPKDKAVKKLDTIRSFPAGYKTCITNPPWLYSPSARRRGLDYPEIKYDDIYKHCLDIALQNCNNVCFIIPATYLQAAIFRERLHSIVFINQRIFVDTDNPVCMAMFTETGSKNINVYNDNTFIGTLRQLESYIPKPKQTKRIIFNSEKGKLGAVCFDNTTEPTIRFCKASEITRTVGHTDRMLTKIECELNADLDTSVRKLNKELSRFRKKTHDVFLTPFKGLRKDGYYRRRINFSMLRTIINAYG